MVPGKKIPGKMILGIKNLRKIGAQKIGLRKIGLRKIGPRKKRGVSVEHRGVCGMLGRDQSMKTQKSETKPKF